MKFPRPQIFVNWWLSTIHPCMVDNRQFTKICGLVVSGYGYPRHYRVPSWVSFIHHLVYLSLSTPRVSTYTSLYCKGFSLGLFPLFCVTRQRLMTGLNKSSVEVPNTLRSPSLSWEVSNRSDFLYIFFLGLLIWTEIRTNCDDFRTTISVKEIRWRSVLTFRLSYLSVHHDMYR